VRASRFEEEVVFGKMLKEVFYKGAQFINRHKVFQIIYVHPTVVVVKVEFTVHVMMRDNLSKHEYFPLLR
jgi:hypothetical protein